ncbi:MAG: hypothetical protein PHY23_00310 [Oscillospiraceae bacterium]|nr:hypothetical protein [Oscillospiraceae bacterium]
MERMVFQGTEKCPQYQWKQYIIGGDKALLEKIRSTQRRPKEWRIVEQPYGALPLKKSA